MKNFGYLLLIGGFLAAAYSTALDTVRTDWTLYVPAAIAAAIGVWCVKRATRGEAKSADVLSANQAELKESLQNIVANLEQMQAAGEAGVARIVYTSSVAVLGLNKDGAPADEDVPVGLDDMVGHYKRSKYLAEQAVREMVSRDGLPTVIVNPSTPIGARDIKPTPSGRIVVDFVNGRMPAYVDTGLNLVHVDDCARGHLLAFERGKVGERYILGGENLSLRDILLNLGRITGRPAPGLRLPNRLLVPFAHVAEGWARLTGSETRLTVDSLRMARKRMFFSSEKAARELGFSSRSAAEALTDAVSWFAENGYFKSAVSSAIHSR